MLHRQPRYNIYYVCMYVCIFSSPPSLYMYVCMYVFLSNSTISVLPWPIILLNTRRPLIRLSQTMQSSLQSCRAAGYVNSVIMWSVLYITFSKLPIIVVGIVIIDNLSNDRVSSRPNLLFYVLRSNRTPTWHSDCTMPRYDPPSIYYSHTVRWPTMMYSCMYVCFMYVLCMYVCMYVSLLSMIVALCHPVVRNSPPSWSIDWTRQR